MKTMDLSRWKRNIDIHVHVYMYSVVCILTVVHAQCTVETDMLVNMFHFPTNPNHSTLGTCIHDLYMYLNSASCLSW